MSNVAMISHFRLSPESPPPANSTTPTTMATMVDEQGSRRMDSLPGPFSLSACALSNQSTNSSIEPCSRRPCSVFPKQRNWIQSLRLHSAVRRLHSLSNPLPTLFNTRFPSLAITVCRLVSPFVRLHLHHLRGLSPSSALASETFKRG